MSDFFYVMDEEARILFVDDDPILREFAQVNLASDAVEIDVAGDGIEGLQALAARPYDLVLVDLDMPRMDGFEVARQVRRDERLAGLPIVMISSRTGTKHTERAHELGVSRFLGKPFQENELLDVIDELVTRS